MSVTKMMTMTMMIMMMMMMTILMTMMLMITRSRKFAIKRSFTKYPTLPSLHYLVKYNLTSPHRMVVDEHF